MVKKKQPADKLSESSPDHYHASESDLSFVVDDEAVSDLRLVTVDALVGARERILQQFKRDRTRKQTVKYDEKEYKNRYMNTRSRTRQRNKFIDDRAKLDKSKSSVRSSLSRGSVIRSNSAAHYAISASSSNKSDISPSKQQVAKILNEKQLFKYVEQKDLSRWKQAFTPLGQLLNGTGCIPYNQFSKITEAADYDIIHEYSNQTALHMLAGHYDNSLRHIMLMSQNDIAIILDQVYESNVRKYKPQTKTVSAGKQDTYRKKQNWIAFLFYLVSRCVDIHVDEFIELALTGFEDHEKHILKVMLRRFDKGGENGADYARNYYLCSYYEKKEDNLKANDKSSGGLRQSNIVSNRLRKRGKNKSNVRVKALESLIRRRHNRSAARRKKVKKQRRRKRIAAFSSSLRKQNSQK